jgi:hypothetical protein
MENKIDTNNKQLSLLEKYKCTEFYYKSLECAKNNQESFKNMCEEEIRKMGECVYKGIKTEEKLTFNK